MQVERKNEQHRYQYHKHRPSQHPQNLKLIDDLRLKLQVQHHRTVKVLRWDNDTATYLRKNAV